MFKYGFHDLRVSCEVWVHHDFQKSHNMKQTDTHFSIIWKPRDPKNSDTPHFYSLSNLVKFGLQLIWYGNFLVFTIQFQTGESLAIFDTLLLLLNFTNFIDEFTDNYRFILLQIL